MKLALAALAASAALALTPVGASAQHVDVGPGGVAVHGDRHGDRHDVEHTHGVEEHRHERPVVHDHHDDVHEHTVVEEHRH